MLAFTLNLIWASLVAQLVKNLPVMWENWVRSLSWGDPLEKGTAILSSILACRIHRLGSQRAGHNWATFTSPRIWSTLGFMRYFLFESLLEKASSLWGVCCVAMLGGLGCFPGIIGSWKGSQSLFHLLPFFNRWGNWQAFTSVFWTHYLT